MSSIEKLRIALQKAEERHMDVARQLTALNGEVERRMAELLEAQQAYVRALERELIVGPSPQSAAKEDLDQWDDPGPDFRKLVIQAGGSNRGERVIANRAIERMGPKAIEPLLAMLSEETVHWERRINVVCAVLVALIVASILQVPTLAGFPGGYWIMLISLPLLVGYAKPLGPHKRAAEALARIDSVRVAGPLIEALVLDDPVITQAAANALKRLFRQLRPGGQSDITDAHWQSLFRSLDQVRDPDLAVAALMALEQVGDERAIALVAPLAEGKGIAAISLDVQRAARDSLEILADHSLRGRVGRTLLRPSSEPGAPDVTLLRAARAGGPDNTQILLHASSETEPPHGSD